MPVAAPFMGALCRDTEHRPKVDICTRFTRSPYQAGVASGLAGRGDGVPNDVRVVARTVIDPS